MTTLIEITYVWDKASKEKRDAENPRGCVPDITEIIYGYTCRRWYGSKGYHTAMQFKYGMQAVISLLDKTFKFTHQDLVIEDLDKKTDMQMDGAEQSFSIRLNPTKRFLREEVTRDD